MILGHVWIDTNDLSADASTVLKLELNYPAVVGNNIQRVQVTTSVCGVPNESRLSCGAELEGSQTEFYYTVCRGVHRIR